MGLKNVYMYFSIFYVFLLSAGAYGKNLKRFMRICVINDNNG